MFGNHERCSNNRRAISNQHALCQSEGYPHVRFRRMCGAMLETRLVEHEVANLSDIATFLDCVLRPPAVDSNDRNDVDEYGVM